MGKVTGLEGVIASETEISLVNGESGQLVYRGHCAKDLALRVTFEEAAYLLWFGKLPEAEELHGGAPTEVIAMLNGIGTKENAEPWLRSVLESGGRLMGFGHRIYKTRDPRAEALQQVSSQLTGDDPWFGLAVHVEAVALRLLEEFNSVSEIGNNSLSGLLRFQKLGLG